MSPSTFPTETRIFNDHVVSPSRDSLTRIENPHPAASKRGVGATPLAPRREGAQLQRNDIPSFCCVGGPGAALSLPLGERPLPHGKEQREHEGVGSEPGKHDIDPAASKTESA